jgi:hypothetical protein
MLFDSYDSERDYGAEFDVDHDAESDFDEPVSMFPRFSPPPRKAPARTARAAGTGRDRTDKPAAFDPSFMPMTRRDAVTSLSHRSVEDTKRFLADRETQCERATSPAGIVLAGGEVLAGAALAGFLAQRFREAGAVVPVGVILGILGIAGAQFEMFGKLSPDVRNVAIGALASAAALWAAGRGIISADALAAQQQAAGAATGAQQQTPVPPVVQQPVYPQVQQQPIYGYPPPSAAAKFGYGPAPQLGTAPQMPSLVDLQNNLQSLFMGRAA